MFFENIKADCQAVTFIGTRIRPACRFSSEEKAIVTGYISVVSKLINNVLIVINKMKVTVTLLFENIRFPYF
jgi:uncharacterized integral membrane protein